MSNPNSLRARLDEMVLQRIHEDDSIPSRRQALEVIGVDLLSKLDAAEAKVKALTAERDGLKVFVSRVAARHYECEDSWYSCPLSEDGCANDSEAKDECTCWAGSARAALKMEGE